MSDECGSVVQLLNGGAGPGNGGNRDGIEQLHNDLDGPNDGDEACKWWVLGLTESENGSKK